MTNATDGLLALGHVTAETDSENPDPAARQAQEQEAKKQEEAQAGAESWAAIMGMIGTGVCMIEPKLAATYSREACMAWGTAANGVAEKYGWNDPGALPELALIVSTAGIGVPTVLLLREKMREVEGEKGEAQSLAAKLGIWWRTRKARKPAAPAVDDANTVDG